MSERERWIVYPLLFFALGAGLRDKFTQKVHTEDLHAGKISCEELIVLDSEKPDRVVAKLSSNPPQPGNPNADRFGVFLLIDSENKELCGVTNNQLQVSQIACKNAFSQSFAVIDPDDPRRTLAGLGSGALPPEQAQGKPQKFGVLVLNNEKFGRVVGFPPTADVKPATPDGAPPPQAENKPVAEPSAK